jgi:4-amino-4-deoxy-L-arabinose transferase-like glycosyltransferase
MESQPSESQAVETEPLTLQSRRSNPIVRALLSNPAWILGFFAALVWFALLGSRPLFRPDEGRYGEIPREMLATGDWLVPHLNGLVYVEKPPLQYWITAGFYRLFGVEVWSARLATGLAAALGVALIGWAARRLWGTRAAVAACAVCASSPLYFLIGQQLTLDMTFTLFLTAALVTFCIAQSVRADRIRCRRWMMLCWAAIAAAVMTKGIAALAIPAGVLAVYSLWQRDTEVWRTSHLPLGLALCLVLSAPWFIVMSQRVPGFAEFFFVHEHLLRYATTSANRYEPWWFFLPVVLAGMAPWLPQMFAASRDRAAVSPARGSFSVERLLWTWVALVVIFFSASKSKLLPYVLPVVPALALIVAASVSRMSVRVVRMSVMVTLAVAGILAAGIVAFAQLAREEKQSVLLDAITPGIVAMALVLALSAGLAFWSARRGNASASLTQVACGWFVAGALLVGWCAAAAGPLYSAEGMARLLEKRDPAPTHIYNVAYYEQTLPFYLRRTVELVDFRGELDFGLRLEPSRALSLQDFTVRWRAESGACALMARSQYQALSNMGLPMTTLKLDPRLALVCRQ